MKLDGLTLQRARLRQGMTMSQVAKKARVTTATVSNAESEKHIYPTTAKRICDVLGLIVADAMLPIRRNGRGDAA